MYLYHDLPGLINLWLQASTNQWGWYWFSESNQKRPAQAQDREAPGMCFTHGEASFYLNFQESRSNQEYLENLKALINVLEAIGRSYICARFKLRLEHNV